MRTIGVLVAVHMDFGLVWMTGQHQCLPECKMLCDQYVFDALKYRIEISGTGTRRYYNKDDKLHRTDGPAVEYADGTKFWYQNGVLHRIDGPAIIFEDGDRRWCINGVQLTEAEFIQAVKNV